MPTGTKPVTGLLSTYLAACASNGWNPHADIRMEDGDDLTDEERAALEALSAEDIQALNDLTDEEFEALDGLSDEDLAKLQKPTGNDPTRRLRNEAARRRNELKPWKAIAKDFDLTPDQVRDIVEASLEEDDDDPKSKRRPKERRRQRDTSADDRANLKAIKVEVKSLAADLFQDPADAYLYLDLDKYEVDEDGDLIDPDELLDDLSEVLERKPHLAAKSRERKSPKPVPGQGRRDARKTSGLDAGRERARARYGKSTNGDS